MTENPDGGDIDYDYDKNGSLTLDATNQKYVYDAENRIKEFFAYKTDQDPYAVYDYDGNGNRVRKVSGPEEAKVETVFVYDGGGQLVAEYSTELAQTARVGYLTKDHLGSPRITTDEDGEVVSRHDYLAYGEDVAEVLGAVGGRSSGQGYGAADEIRKKYTGYERDDESGLDYAKARYYNSYHGRYTSSDPLMASADTKNPQTFNRYTYVLNSPYKFTDPLGLIPQNKSANGGKGWAWCSTCRSFDDGIEYVEPPVVVHSNPGDGNSAGNGHESPAGLIHGEQQEAEEAREPEISLVSFKLVVRRPKLVNGEPVFENGEQVVEETVLLTGTEGPADAGIAASIDVSPILEELKNGIVGGLYLKFEFKILNDSRATFVPHGGINAEYFTREAFTITAGTNPDNFTLSKAPDSVNTSVVLQSGTVYASLRGDVSQYRGFRHGESGYVTVTARAFYTDQINSRGVSEQKTSKPFKFRFKIYTPPLP